MGFLKSRKGAIISDYFEVQHDLGVFAKGDMLDVALLDGHLAIKGPLRKQENTLRYAQITDVYYGLRTEAVEKNKSVIGRAVVGGLLFGGVGATVGSVSGVGKKETRKAKRRFMIAYTNQAGEDAFLDLVDTRMYRGRKVARKLAELCGLDKPDVPDGDINL